MFCGFSWTRHSPWVLEPPGFGRQFKPAVQSQRSRRRRDLDLGLPPKRHISPSWRTLWHRPPPGYWTQHQPSPQSRDRTHFPFFAPVGENESEFRIIINRIIYKQMKIWQTHARSVIWAHHDNWRLFWCFWYTQCRATFKNPRTCVFTSANVVLSLTISSWNS